MRDQKIERYKFIFTYNGVDFDVFFFIDGDFWLYFGVLKYNLYFEKRVKKGFIIDVGFDEDTYTNLIEVLKLNYSENGPFKPSYFFNEFNKKIPDRAYKKFVPKPHEIARHIRNVEECDKIYFCGWLDNNIAGNHVQKSNLIKTQKLLSQDAYEMCKEKNISSKWTDIEEKCKDFDITELKSM
jgi:hypothetical protein